MVASTPRPKEGSVWRDSGMSVKGIGDNLASGQELPVPAVSRRMDHAERAAMWMQALSQTSCDSKSCTECCLIYGVRHFRPKTSSPDGLQDMCNGCSYRRRRLRKLMGEQGVSAEEYRCFNLCVWFAPLHDARTVFDDFFRLASGSFSSWERVHAAPCNRALLFVPKAELLMVS